MPRRMYCVLLLLLASRVLAQARDERPDRYIVNPAQALAYKSGELEMKALCTYAERELGARFDIRAFHDQLLSEGGLPLDILDARLRAWVAAQKTRT